MQILHEQNRICHGNPGYVQEVGFILRYFFIECLILFPINICRLQIFLVSLHYEFFVT